VIRTVHVSELRDGDRGARYLVDRIWPRGVRRDRLALTGWARGVAPSDDLRRWFGHDPVRWVEFRRRYSAELDRRPGEWRPLLDAADAGDLLLLYGARDREHNNAVALRDYLQRQLAGDPRNADDLGGDPVCWLDRVCPACGRLGEDRTATTCPECGATLPGPA
jgi:uncharacterized protein YeaO (DUF488 family)